MTATKRGSTTKQGQIGINVVERIVIDELDARWQQLDAQNDDGVDGLIFFESELGKISGEILHVQVKCWERKPSSLTGDVAVLSLGEQHLYEHAATWQGVAGGSILVWVNPENRNAYWVSLKRGSTFAGAHVTIPLTQKFDGSARNALRQLCGTMAPDQLLKQLQAQPCDFRHMAINRSLRESTKQTYRMLRQITARDPQLGEVSFTRLGWRHITRKGRSISRIWHSLTLINIAKRIVEEVQPARCVRTWRKGSDVVGEVYELTARVSFPSRDPAVVRVLLLRRLRGSKFETIFYSVYERRRRKGLLGERLDI
jgi:hypothetical protein